MLSISINKHESRVILFDLCSLLLVGAFLSKFIKAHLRCFVKIIIFWLTAFERRWIFVLITHIIVYLLHAIFEFPNWYMSQFTWQRCQKYFRIKSCCLYWRCSRLVEDGIFPSFKGNILWLAHQGHFLGRWSLIYTITANLPQEQCLSRCPKARIRPRWKPNFILLFIWCALQIVFCRVVIRFRQ